MQFEKQKVITVITADDIKVESLQEGLYGYFAHDLDSLRKAVSNEKTSCRCMYGKLTKILDATNKARFVLGRGDFMFALFYPTDTYLNMGRY